MATRLRRFARDLDAVELLCRGDFESRADPGAEGAAAGGGRARSALRPCAFRLSLRYFCFSVHVQLPELFRAQEPLAVVQAFRKAFGGRQDVLLVLKTSSSDFAPEAHQQLVAASRGANVRIIDEYLDRAEIDAMVAACDAYVSLHRSEGYGLTLAEAWCSANR
ncbi:MAG: hypothetical protein HC897_12030 [Thermoanaerobaculia bacterium]|nr:hypothetical protein [Thermoanaerobaculia bacterium]